MNETIWPSGSDGDLMLDFVADRLAPRHWFLISAAHVRRLWDLLPDGVLRQAIDAAELAEQPLLEKERAEWLMKIDAALPAGIAAAELAQREIVKSSDPDSADLENPVLERPTQSAPAFPLFRAASNQARNSIERIGEAMSQAAEAVRRLFAEPNEEMLDLVREAVNQAAETRLRANQAAADSLRLKQEGDETADRAASLKNKRIEEAKALEFVRRMEEGRRQGGDDWAAEDQVEKAAKKQLARVLREVLGNPFKPPRFEHLANEHRGRPRPRHLRGANLRPPAAARRRAARCRLRRGTNFTALPGHRDRREGTGSTHSRLLGRGTDFGAVVAVATARAGCETAEAARTGRRLRPRPAPRRRR